MRGLFLRGHPNAEEFMSNSDFGMNNSNKLDRKEQKEAIWNSQSGTIDIDVDLKVVGSSFMVPDWYMSNIKFYCLGAAS